MNNSSYLKLVKNNDNLRLLKEAFILINAGLYVKDDYSTEHALHKDQLLRKTSIGKVLDKAKQSFYK